MRKCFFFLLCLLGMTGLFAQNPVMLRDVYPGITGSNIAEIVKTSNYTFFNAEDDDADADRGLYRTDGTPGGTIKLNLSYPTYISTKADKLTALGNKIVFAGDNFDGYYGEIWSSDGTQAGTIGIERFLPSQPNRGPVLELCKAGSFVFYGVVNDANHTLLKKTDGTIAGTSVVYDFAGFTRPELALMREMNGILYFDVYDVNGTGADQLWRSDGTQAGTYMIYDFGTTRYMASYFMVAGNDFYMMIVTPGTGNVLWKSNGTAAGTMAVKTIGSSGNNNYPSYVAIGSTLYFAGLDGNGKELWKTDGTAAGTVMVADINAGAASSNPNFLTLLNGIIYFGATGPNGNELWKYDGSTASEVKDIYPGTTGSFPLGLVASNNTIVFRAANDASGSELWISDGTAANTKMVADINPTGASAPTLLTAGNPVFFSANNGANGAEIFKFDNSAPVTDIHSNVYVNDNSVSGDVFTTAAGNNANPGTKAAPVLTITQAISIAQPGDTIWVDAGVYAERVFANKPLYFKGAYAGVNPGSSLSRGVSETILIPSAENNLLEIVTVQSSNVSFDGFLFDGDNPSITGTIMLNGVDVNAGMALYNGGNATDNVVIKNNIIKNFYRYGLLVQRPGTPVVNGTLVTQNHLDNISSRAGRDGRAVGFFANTYGAITNNTMTRVHSGAFIANQNTGSTDSILISNNNIQAYSAAVVVSNTVNLTSSVRINNNQFSLADLSTWNAPGSSTVNNATGISAGGISSTKVVSFENNTITGFFNGIFPASVNTPEGLQISGGSVSNSPGVGVFYIGQDPVTAKLALSNISLQNNAVAIDVSATDDTDMPVEFNNVSTTGGTTGLRVYGRHVKLASNTLSGISFTGQTGQYILLSHYAFDGIAIDATSVLFDGLTGAGMTLAQRFAAENKIIHRVDYNGGGFIRIKAGEVCVTTSSFTNSYSADWGTPTTTADINRAVASASAGDFVQIGAGTFVNQVNLDKALTLQGSGAGNTVIMGPSTPLTPLPDFGEKSIIQGLSGIGDVTVRDLSIDGQNSDEVHAILIQGGGLVFGCEIARVNNGIFFRYEPAAPRTAAAAENYIHDLGYVGINFAGTQLGAVMNQNTIDLTGSPFGMGIIGGFDFGSLPFFTANNNVIRNWNGWGIFANAQSGSISNNSITGSNGYAIQTNSNLKNATCNWFGSTDESVVATKVSGNLNYYPWLTNGTDNEPFNAGFQPVPGSCGGRPTKYYVNDNSQTGDVFTTAVGNNGNNGSSASPFATVDYAYSIAQANDTIFVDAGIFNLAGANYPIQKAITIYGANYTVSPNNAADKLVANGSRNAESVITNGNYTLSSSNITMSGFTFDPGNRNIFSMNNGTGAVAWNNIRFAKNIFKITNTTAGLNVMNITGKTVTTPSLPINSGLTVTDSRFEKTGSATGTSISFNYFSNVSVTDNAFLVTGATVKTQTAVLLGNTGVASSVTVTGNAIDNGATFVNGNRFYSGSMLNNRIINTDRALQYATSEVYPDMLEFSNNTLIATTGGGGFINYARSGSTAAGTTSYFKMENNTITGTPAAGVANQLFGALNASANNAVQNHSFLIRGNKIIYNGDFSNVQGQFIRPLTVRGNLADVTIENNELSFSNSGGVLASPPPPSGLPVMPGITINTDFGVASYMVSGSVVNIRNNKVSGFKQSLIFYDPVDGVNPFNGYGGIPAGCTVNINNNSFALDSISINNGTTSAVVTANCNWYGTPAAQDVAQKVSASTVNYTPWLSNGTDSDLPATGFQPVAGSCNGTPVSAVVTQVTHVTCHGANNGTINITVNGGVTPYHFAWTRDDDANYSAITEDLNGLAPDTYHVTVTDANGSFATLEVTITEPDALTATAEGTNNTCYGSAAGTATVSAAGGTTAYSYLWSNGGTTETITGLVAGTYTATVTDANGCTASANYTVTQPAQLTATLTNTSTACANSATVAAAGGTPGYSYLWSNGATASSISSVPAGTYSVTVTDANGCSVSGSITLSGNQAFNPSASVTNVSCYGTATGRITITNANGQAPFQYSINGIDFQSSNVFSNLVAGTYTITVRDFNGCTGFVTKTITQPLQLVLTLNSVQSTCYGTNTGAITVSGTGGTGNIAYSWTGPNGYSSAQRNISSLAAGNYNLTATDNNGCTATLQVVVPAFNQVNVTSVVTNIACKGELNGSINLTVNGGTGSGFSYNWTNGATTEDLANLGTGNYSVTITDIGSGCTVNRSFTITQPSTAVSLSTTKTNATGCNTLGTITATGSGGTAPYQYNLDNGFYQSGGNFTGLYAGSYTVWVKDANGCTKTAVVAITDNGGDQYESNNSKNQAATIATANIVSGRLALSTDIADWFKFTTTTGGRYVVTLTHPNINYTFRLYAAGNNTPPVTPTDSTNSTKGYTLAANTTYYVSITGGLSYTCYQLLVNQAIGARPVELITEKQPVIQVEELTTSVYPNPHNGSFTLVIESPEAGTAKVDLYTISGQRITERNVQVKYGKNNVPFTGIRQGTILYRVQIGKHNKNGTIIGIE